MSANTVYQLDTGSNPIMEYGAHFYREEDFKRIRQFLLDETGIYLSDSKSILVYSRLVNILRRDGYKTFSSFIAQILKDSDSARKRNLIDLLTTNETHFFREAAHFKFLKEQVLPEFHDKKAINIWSAACSSGEEPYSIAMVLDNYPVKLNWRLLASDISERMLVSAKAGIYSTARGRQIPDDLLKKYCLRGLGENSGKICIDYKLRKKVDFKRVNLLKPVNTRGSFDMIWLRNTLIYFENDVKKKIIGNLLNYLRTGGYFIVGHSESLIGIHDNFNIEKVRTSIYRKK